MALLLLHEPHPPRDRAGQLVGDGAGAFGNALDRQLRAPQDDRVAHARIHAAQVIGRVSMDLMAIDLRGVDARVGDPVILWGPELPVERIAEGAGTIAYELTCSITRRVRFVEQ